MLVEVRENFTLVNFQTTNIKFMVNDSVINVLDEDELSKSTMSSLVVLLLVRLSAEQHVARLWIFSLM